MHIELLQLIGHAMHDFLINSRIYFLWFCIYSFVGWFYESTICSLVKYHKVINRGYLRGPVCPIYGVGAVANFLLLWQIGSAPGIFVAAMIVSGVVEYFTSFAMEKLFHQRWWDYTRYRFNLHGRICLYGCVIFGVANVIILKVIHPTVMYFTIGISDSMLTIVTVGLYITFLVDVIYTTLHMESVNTRVREWNLQLRQKREDIKENVVEIWSQAETRTKEFKTEIRVMTSESRCYEWIEKIKDRFVS